MNTSQGSLRVISYSTAKDASLENRVANYLYHRHVPGCEGIHTSAHRGTVVVRGQLPSQHAKWLCFECCSRVAGVIRLIDNVAVKCDKTGKPLRCRVSTVLDMACETPHRNPNSQLRMTAAPCVRAA
ncbi:hypothetical protein Pr1d_48430 [Bythopirellula goksoeyrii]|uniref:BON domain protein n=1 Tax=Bythopirellula goksoeyrii TaxID=1400387 RepID=A0A5B9QEM7_9BACT|nr:hypothetical protein Pr1d_48430 [Bythopirellula goksoeyrii]